jgi:hypothetical protein
MKSHLKMANKGLRPSQAQLENIVTVACIRRPLHQVVEGGKSTSGTEFKELVELYKRQVQQALKHQCKRVRVIMEQVSVGNHVICIGVLEASRRLRESLKPSLPVTRIEQGLH